MVFFSICNCQTPAFANGQDIGSYTLSTSDCRVELTEDELLAILDNVEDIEIVKVLNDDQSNYLESKSMYRSLSSTGTLNGTYELCILGLGLVVVKVYNDTVKIGNQMFSLYSAVGKKVSKAIEDYKFAKNNPTGRKVRDVEKRLKKEGFEKVKNNGGSHQKWKKKGNEKFVNVPNHGGSYEIPIGTLRQLWKDAGWL